MLVYISCNSGGTFLRDQLNELLIESDKWNALQYNDRRGVCNVGFTKMTSNLFPRRDFLTGTDKSKGRLKCSMYSSETSYPSTITATTLFDHVYTTVRDPKSHVISQYFHCKESVHHRDRAKFMPPTLQEWLDAWVLAMGDESKIRENENKFQCYNPINLQSSYVRFDPDVQPTAEKDLLERYDVIGTSDEMVKSLCATFISYQGYVPEKCDCTDTTLRKRRMDRYDHGVSHHGSSYETTLEEDEAIAKLTQKDLQLFEVSQKVFEKQVLGLEEMFGIKVCSSFKYN